MKTKDLIKERARILFNKHGVTNITLRHIAQAIDKSYGNVTYHYKNKLTLIMDLYLAMNHEIEKLQLEFSSHDLLKSVLEAPRFTFSVSLKYAFFLTDYMELKRNFSPVAEQLQKDNLTRKSFYLNILKQLQLQQQLREDLGDNDLDYLMDLSGMVRTYFFISLAPEDSRLEQLEEDRYVTMVNQLLYPYLSAEGIEQFRNWHQNFNNPD